MPTPVPMPMQTQAPTPVPTPEPTSVPTLVPTPSPAESPIPSPASPVEDCTGCSTCVAVPNNVHGQAVNDQQCSPCALGVQTWWPCNLDGLCRCSGSSGEGDAS